MLLNVLGVIGLTPQLQSMPKFAQLPSIAKSTRSMRFPISLLAGTAATGASLIAGNVYASFNNYSKAVKSGETYNSSPNYNKVTIGGLSVAGGFAAAKMQKNITTKNTVQANLAKIIKQSIRCGGRIGLFAILAKPALDIVWEKSKPHITNAIQQVHSSSKTLVTNSIKRVRDATQEALENLE